MSRLQGDMEIACEEEVDDFDVPDEVPPLETMNEVIAMERQAPKLKEKEPSLEDRAKVEAEYRELVDREVLMRRRHREAALKKQADDAKEELALYSEPLKE